MSSKLFRFVFLITGSTCMAAILFVGFRWRAARTSAENAVDELAACQQIAAQIQTYRAAPQMALLEKQSHQQVLLAIESAAQIAKIPDSDILRITPQQGRRRGKSDHVEQPTSVEIRDVTMQQLARFLNELNLLDVGLQPTTIRLAAPRDAPRQTAATVSDSAGHALDETWTCNLVLTYLVFSPK